MTEASIKDVAHEAGVSVGTVSNVLNNPQRVSDTTRDKVLEAIAHLGYVRNESARQLRTGSSRTIGLVVLDVANPYFTDVARGVERHADERGLVITIHNSGDFVMRENRHLELLLEQRARGVLITPVQASNPRIDRLVAAGVKVVLLDRVAGGGRLCSVSVDDVLGGRVGVAHLVERGHEHIAFVGGPSSIQQVADRRRGASDALAEAGADDSNLLVISTPALTFAAGRLAGEKIALLPEVERPTGVFCANDLLALGVLQELVHQGIRVPEQVAIVGYDDVMLASTAAVPLSSVRQPREELGRAAAALLFEEIEDEDEHRHRSRVFEPELIVRTSSASGR